MTAAHGPRDIPALTSIRGFAAWWVVVYHIREVFAPHVNGATMAFLSKGYLAVDMFFVLSGFVIYLNYAGKLEPTAASLSDFIAKRVARVYPLHLLLLLATTPYALARLYREGALPEIYGVDSFVMNLALVHNWGFTDVLSWNVPSWSISTELAAYLLFPIVPLALTPRRWPGWLLPMVIVALALLLHAAFAAQGAETLGWNVPKTALVRCVAQFAIGTLVCEMFLRLRGARLAAGPLSVALLAMAGGALAGVLLLDWPETLTLPLLWAALILGMALWPASLPNPLDWRPLVYVGDVSYATYLCHYLAFIAFKLVFVDDLAAVPLHLILLFLAGVAIASVALYHGFERPAQRWVMARWRERSGHGATTRKIDAARG